MAQIRIWNFGDTFTAKKAKDAQRALNKPGRYLGFTATVTDSDKISLAPDGFALMPNGTLVSEDTAVTILFPTLPVLPTTYSITLRHSDINTLGGNAAVYALETGQLDEIQADGIVICYVDHPGGAVALNQSYIRMSESQQDSIGSPSGNAGGDLYGTYPNPGVGKLRNKAISSTPPVAGDILRYSGTEYVPVSATSIVGTGIPAAYWTIQTPVSGGNFIQGFREFGVSCIIQTVVLSQEIAGISGTFTADLYKIAATGTPTPTETLIGTYSITSIAGNKARVVSNSFQPGSPNTLTATDRLGIKVTSTQAGPLEDITLTVLVSGAALPPPPPLDKRAIVQAVNITSIGTAYTHVGSVHLVQGTINGNNTRFLVGTTSTSEAFTLEIRKFGSVIPIATITASGVPQDYSLGSDLSIFQDGFYDIYVKGNSPTAVVQVKGFKIVYEPVNRRDILQALTATVTGTTFNHIGSIYLPAGTLQSGSQFLFGTDGSGTATLEIRRFSTGGLIGTLTSTGLIQVVTPAAPINVPYPEFYDLYLKSSTISSTALLSGLNLVVIP
jgi:hypothetical protein